MLQHALTWIVMTAVLAAGIAFAGQQSLAEDAADTFTTLVVVGLMAQWLYRDTPGFRPKKFWVALLTLGIVMLGLRWIVHR